MWETCIHGIQDESTNLLVDKERNYNFALFSRLSLSSSQLESVKCLTIIYTNSFHFDIFAKNNLQLYCTFWKFTDNAQNFKGHIDRKKHHRKIKNCSSKK